MANGLFNLKQVMQGIQQGGWNGQKPPSVEYLVVAGGGGGWLAAGGAGGLLAGVNPVPNGQTLLVTVGAGGASNTSNGSNSVFGSILATGGGHGGDNSGATSTSGGSGGAGYNTNAASRGVSGQGNDGAIGTSSNSGGGGGAGTAGLPGPATGIGGNGGAGISSVISGTVTTYAGGGGGSGSSTGGTGGVGGGGNGSGAAQGTAGSANTGGGAGGDLIVGSKAGGSGIVIVSYPDVYAAPTATTGSPTVSTSGSGSVNFATAGYFSTGTGTAPSQSGDFTLEGWFNLSTFNQSGGYALLGGTTSGANYFGFKGTNTVVNSATTSTEKLIACTLPSTNTWFHYCLMRSGTTLYAFLNGSLQGSSTWTDVLFSSGSLLVGGYGSATYICPGYMSNLRLTNTAVYSTSGFTVPTSPLTRVTGTALLMNTVSGAYAADATGTWSFLNLYTAPTWNASSPFTVTGYKNRVYTWTSSGSITF